MIDFSRLNELYDECRKFGVSFSLTYEEPCDSFNISINSPAKNENCITRTRSLDIVIDYAINFLKNLDRLTTVSDN